MSATRVKIGAAALSMLAVTLLVLRVSSAAFSATTVNESNSWDAGTVVLNDDDAAGAMFTVDGMVPGSVVEKCITVTYAGDVEDADSDAEINAVKLYATASGDLAPHLDVVVQRGTGGGFSSCTGFSSSESVFTGTLAALATTHTDYSDGAGTWDPATTGDAQTYRFEVTLGSDTTNDSQGHTAAAAFTWETQTTGN